MKEVVINYFTDLFTTRHPDFQDFPIWFNEGMVSETQKQTLLLLVTETEVRRAVFEMGPDKSPGPDDLNPRFFQHFWPVVAEEVIRFVQSVVATGTFDSHLNVTNVV